jgi:hypothetical protein
VLLRFINIEKPTRWPGRKKVRKMYAFTPEVDKVMTQIAKERNVSRQLLVENALLTFDDVRTRVGKLNQLRVDKEPGPVGIWAGEHESVV